MEIRINGLTKIFPPNIQALSDIYLNINEGEFVYLIGTTGSGKTTLMRLLTREVLPTRGQVVMDGIDLRRLSTSSLPYFRRDIGVVFQDYKLLPYLSAWENVAFVLEACGVPRAEARDRTDDVIDKVGLWNRRDLRPDQLSGGEQQRVCIARALINSPRILLGDEPTGNLDEENERIVVDLFHRLHDEGVTLIVVTHDPEVGDVAQRKIVLEYGKLAQDVDQRATFSGVLKL